MTAQRQTGESNLLYSCQKKKKKNKPQKKKKNQKPQMDNKTEKAMFFSAKTEKPT